MNVRTQVENSLPDVVIHMAGISHIPTCESSPEEAYRINVLGTALLLEVLQQKKLCPRFIFFSSAQVYQAASAHEGNSPIIFDEKRAIVPQNTYARTKWMCEQIIKGATESSELKAQVLRLFNHTHRNQPPHFVLPHLFHAIRDAKENGSRQIPTGNLEVHRDFGLLSDAIEAICRLVDTASTEKFVPFNLCSGQSRSLKNLANEMKTQMQADIEFVFDTSRARPGEPHFVQGSCDRLSQHLGGWHPQGQRLTDPEWVTEFLSEG
jgi:nucleoside-diphosphate-sugar epimerase